MKTLAIKDPDMINVFEAFLSCKKIVVVTGAGISCSSGIPVNFLPFEG